MFDVPESGYMSWVGGGKLASTSIASEQVYLAAELH
jgi:hypothetical protein